MTYAEIIQQIANLFADNTAGEISASDLRTVTDNLATENKVDRDNITAEALRTHGISYDDTKAQLDVAVPLVLEQQQTVPSDPAQAMASKELMSIGSVFSVFKPFSETVLKKDGSVPMDDGYLPHAPKDIVTRDYIDPTITRNATRTTIPKGNVYIGGGLEGVDLHLDNKLGETAVLSGGAGSQEWLVGRFPKDTVNGNADDLSLVSQTGGIFMQIEDGHTIRVKRGNTIIDMLKLDRPTVVSAYSATPTKAELITAAKLLPQYTNDADFWSGDHDFYVRDDPQTKMLLVKYRGVSTNVDEGSAGNFFFEKLSKAS